MTTSSKPKSKKPADNGRAVNKSKQQIANPVNLSSDPDYIKLIEYYQQAEFAKCKEMLEKIEKQYPKDPDLLEFKDDLHLKMSFLNMELSSEKEEKQKKKKEILKKSVFAVIATLLVMIVYFFVFYLINNKIANKQLEEETAYLTSLAYQAGQLLQSEQPQPAAEIIERIRAINPEFERLPELTLRVDDLIRLEANYQTAINLIAENKDNEALVILNEIEAEKPGLWDVGQQIDSIQTTFKIAKYLEEGNAAYQDEKWDQVISAYENALKLDPKLVDPLVNEQLLKGYLNRILSMLDNKNTSIEDVENAEEYYRKAVAMTSQSKAFASEKENLQQASNSLLVLKYTLLAKSNLEDKNQTASSVAQAVSYLKKAANLEPENTDLNSELKNAEDYEIAFNKFIYMNWDEAISYLDRIAAVDPNYANGNVRLLRYEAYYALGKDFSSLGLYLDAINKFEQAEILAWSDSDNLIKLFQVQVLLGDMLAKVNNYEDSVSYYKFTLNTIMNDKKLADFPAIAAKLTEADDLVTYRKFEDAFEAYNEILKDIDVVYLKPEIEISDGVCLALFASENLSTVDAILEANNLPESMVITFGQKLRVPMIEK